MRLRYRSAIAILSYRVIGFHPRAVADQRILFRAPDIAQQKSDPLKLSKSLDCRVVLPAGAGAAGSLALLPEAIRAVNRLVATRHERHLGLASTRCASRAVHLALTTTVAAAVAAV